MSYGLMVDLRAIQDYIFSSNRLRDNIGASYLVSLFFDSFYDSENGFQGGGNLFRLCNGEEEAKSIIQQLSRRVIEESPGLSFNAVYLDDFDSDSFRQHFTELTKKMQQEKQSRHQLTILPSHGINTQCAASAYAAEFDEKDPGGQRSFVSEAIHAKRRAAIAATQAAEKVYAPILNGKYAFTEVFDQLGQLKDHESFIAVVHIDGNDIGREFERLNSLSAYRNYSQKVDEAFHKAFEDVLAFCIEMIETNTWLNYSERLVKNDAGQIVLPVRPLYIGGDDLSFVCEGRLGIELAIKFMTSLRKRMNEDISSCAGIAVSKTNFPFYQVQKMANSLCRSAKNKRKETGSSGDFLDFHLISSSISIPINEIRTKQYELSDKRKLYHMPYSISQMQAQIRNARQFYRNWPNSKIKDMRAALYQSKEQLETFEIQLSTRPELKLYH